MKPLAERMRPSNFDDYLGQEKLVGKEGILRKSIDNGFVPSMILFGPPGVGKTTLGKIIAKQSKRKYFELSATSSSVKDIREVMKAAQDSRFFNSASPILFIDEIHRFSKNQQDSLLKGIEDGTVVLVGATTENPSFELNNALLSRCQVFVLNPLNEDHLHNLLVKAIVEDEELRKSEIDLIESQNLIQFSGGDVRMLYNALESVVQHEIDREKISITNELVSQILSKKWPQYDKDGDNHYDIISAFIKSIRGSDPNATLYWLARMLDAGESEKFICRRMIISAAEDIGLANPNAMLLAVSTLQGVQAVGFPEARILMSQCAIYLANSAKSNTAYSAINAALETAKKYNQEGVPHYLKSRNSKWSDTKGSQEKYKYPHDYEDNFVPQGYLPSNLKDEVFYFPGNNVAEQKFYNSLKKMWPKKYY